jgi:hypothetical protein
MPQPITGSVHAQHSCALTTPPKIPTTLDARLRAFYAEHDADNPCRLSVPELAARFAPRCKPANGEREILRAHGRIRRTHRDQFHERRQCYGRAPVATARWWTKDPGCSGRSVVTSSSEVDLRTGQLDQTASADRARARPVAPRSTRRVEKRNRAAREGRGFLAAARCRTG